MNSQQDALTPPRAFCVEQFISISGPLKLTILSTMENFHLCMTSNMDTGDFMNQVFDVCRRIEEEGKTAGPLGGLIADFNYINFWNLIRSYKNKQRAAKANQVPCALMSQALLKFQVERVVYASDRLFLTAPCSGINMPQKLAQAFYVLAMDLRARCQASWKNLSSGRRQTMHNLQTLCDLYKEMDSNNIICDTLKAFLKFTFPPCKSQTIIGLLKQAGCNQGNGRSAKNMENMKPTSKAPHCGILAKILGVNTFSLPDAVIGGINAEGMLNKDVCDVSWYIRYPKELIKMDYFQYIQLYCSQDAMSKDMPVHSDDHQLQPQQGVQNVTEQLPPQQETAQHYCLENIANSVPTPGDYQQPQPYVQTVTQQLPSQQEVAQQHYPLENIANSITTIDISAIYPSDQSLPVESNVLNQTPTMNNVTSCKKRKNTTTLENQNKMFKATSSTHMEQPGPDPESEMLDSFLVNMFGLSSSDELPKPPESPPRPTTSAESVPLGTLPPETCSTTYTDLYGLQQVRLEDFFFE
ncbi:ORF50 [Felid gammaherpesvirus 1]|uniref:ORF50 n=1 Tax=Felid gammaherpesvirus 1 TaxID=2560468 RepID=A0A0M4M149_9GAMA|nr:ORF50 [Felis catus gammaherpesvirus 1]ALE14760.1 ORF50 [Felis catus gammaherpesvirus 1]